MLLGRNGCGKTTLLKTTLGLCTPEQGQILFDGQALGAMKRQQRAQVAAYVPQELQFGALRVYDAVLAGRVSRFGIQPGAADRTAAEAALADMDLTALAERNVQTLSGGERQKVAIARALAQEPKLLVFDEPTGNLDVANEQRILRQARRLARTRGMTVLCTLHDLNQACRYADHLVVMREGQIVEVMFHTEKETVLSAELPPIIDMEVTYTEPGVKGDTASTNSLKPATVDTGATIRVPLFIQTGEKIRVDSRTREYSERIKE